MEQGNKVIFLQRNKGKRHQFLRTGEYNILSGKKINMYPHILHYNKYDRYIYIALPCSVETGNVWATTTGSFLALIYGFILL